MRALLVTLICLTPCATLADETKPALKTFTSQAGGFSVMFPGDPQESKEEGDGMVQYQFEVDRPNGTFLVSYHDAPDLKGKDLDDLRKRLVSGQDRVRNGFQGNVLDSKPLTLDKTYPGLDYSCDMPAAGGIYRSRSYLVDGRIYQVIAIGTKDFATSDEADEYLDSFKLLKK